MAAARIQFSLADVDDPRRDVARRIGLAGGPWDMAVINGRARRFWTRSAGGFSLKWMAEGRACYRLERRPHTVSRTAAVLVDHDQPYEMEFEGRGASQSFCLFYSKALVADAWASVEAGFDPGPAPAGLRGFPNVVFQPSERLAGILAGLAEDGPNADAGQMETRLLLALADAVETAHGHRGVARRLPAVKAVTRAHLLGLIERARIMIAEADGIGITLDDLAAQAGLSKFHFLRLFKRAHGQSPLAYAEDRRLLAAQARLRSTRQPIGEIAAGLGYESPSAFAKAFRRHTGAAPTAFRAASVN